LGKRRVLRQPLAPGRRQAGAFFISVKDSFQKSDNEKDK